MSALFLLCQQIQSHVLCPNKIYSSLVVLWILISLNLHNSIKLIYFVVNLCLLLMLWCNSTCDLKQISNRLNNSRGKLKTKLFIRQSTLLIRNENHFVTFQLCRLWLHCVTTDPCLKSVYIVSNFNSIFTWPAVLSAINVESGEEFYRFVLPRCGVE